MKKLAIGCLIVLVVVAVIAGVLGYVAYDRFYRPIRSFALNMQQVSEMDKQVQNTQAFSAPENGELTEELVSRFMRVQEHMQGKLGQRMAELKATYEKLNLTIKDEKRSASITEMLGAVRDLGSLVVEGKKAQIEALNQAGFSLREYEWVRQQAYAAIGIAAARFDLKKLARDAQTGRLNAESLRDEPTIGDVPERNKTLVAPFEEKLKEWAPLAMFGL